MAIRCGKPAMPVRVPSTLLSAALVAGCAGVPLPVQAPAELFADDAFAPVALDTDPAQAVAMSPAMQRFVDTEVRALVRVHGTRQALVQALLRMPRLKLEYDASATRSAAEAFDAHAGNCLSLTLMVGTLAQALGLAVSYQQVWAGDAWSRSGGLLAYSGHVNAVIDHGPAHGAGARWQQRLIVDFLPPEDVAAYPASPISEATVLAMFANNRAAEALAGGRIDEAYAWVRSALRSQPALVPAWNTLALLLRQRGRDAQALRVLQRAAAAEPDNTRVLANLVAGLQSAGHSADAAAWRERLQRLEPVAPFVWFDRGRSAMALGQWPAAADAFARELARDPDQHEVQLWAARAAAELGDAAGARRHLQQARALAPTPALQTLYAAKLERLNAARRD